MDSIDSKQNCYPESSPSYDQAEWKSIRVTAVKARRQQATD
jgi:hypothetical protein